LTATRYPDRDAVRSALAEFVAGEPTFPRRGDFLAAGLDDLYKAACNKGGIAYWRDQVPAGDVVQPHEHACGWQADPEAMWIEVLVGGRRYGWAGEAQTGADASLAISASGWRDGDELLLDGRQRSLRGTQQARFDDLPAAPRKRALRLTEAVLCLENDRGVRSKQPQTAERRAARQVWRWVDLTEGPYAGAEPVVLVAPTKPLTAMRAQVNVEFAGDVPEWFFDRVGANVSVSEDAW